MKLVVVAAVALALAAPAAAAPKLSKADRAAITRTIDAFVNHGVKRVGTAASYDLVAPEMRAGTTRKAWARGDIPVYPFPAAGRTHPWNILYVTREEVGVELELIPRPHSDVGPIIFHVALTPSHGRWLVNAFMPVATLAPLDAKKSKVRSVRDFAPQAAGGVSLGGGSHGQINRIYIVVPFAALALVLLGLATWGVTRAVRNRRLHDRRGGPLPPLPRSGA